MPKPEFNPNQPYEPAVNAGKPEFDPSKPYEMAEAPAKEFGDISPLESGALGASQGVTLGFGDEIAGGVKAGYQKITGSEEPFTDLYRKNQKEQERYLEQAQKENPKSYLGGQVGGDVALSFVPGMGLAKGASLAKNIGKAALLGGTYGAGVSHGTIEGDPGQIASDAGFGAATGGVTQGLLSGASNVAKKFSPDDLRVFANKAAKNATGATGKQSAEFAPDAGQKLIDEGIVTFGSNAQGVAKKAEQKLMESNKNIDTALTQLDAKGAGIPKEMIVDKLNDLVKKYEGRASQAGVVKQIKGHIDDIMAGSDVLPLSVAEQEKRAFQGQVNYMTDKITEKAKKDVARVYRETVEQEANRLDPSLGKLFKDAKESYKLVAPVQEAAEKRANTLNQSPWGGLLDTGAATGMGAATGLAGGDYKDMSAAAILGAIGRRHIMPRASSSAAVGASKLAGALEKSPEAMKKSAEALYNAARSGVLPQSIARRIIDEYERGNP